MAPKSASTSFQVYAVPKSWWKYTTVDNYLNSKYPMWLAVNSILTFMTVFFSYFRTITPLPYKPPASLSRGWNENSFIHSFIHSCIQLTFYSLRSSSAQIKCPYNLTPRSPPGVFLEEEFLMCFHYKFNASNFRLD